jgi:hypothetical protein
MRDLVRAGMTYTRPETTTGAQCVATVIYVYDRARANSPSGWRTPISVNTI